MSSKFSKLFKARSTRRADALATSKNSSDNFSLSVASLSSNSTEVATNNDQQSSFDKDGDTGNGKDTKHHFNSKTSSVSSLLTKTNNNSSNDNKSDIFNDSNNNNNINNSHNHSNNASAASLRRTATSNSAARNPATAMGSSVVFNAPNMPSSNNGAAGSSSDTPTINEAASSFTASSQDSNPNGDDVVLKFTDAQVRLLKWSWNENISTPKEKDFVNKTATLSDPSSSANTKVKVNSISETFASAQFWSEIYNNVYLIDSELKKLLPTPEHQTVFFTGIIRMAVLNAGDLSVMNEYLKSIGRRHGIIFGAEPTYFQTLGIAIIRALNDRFGDDFSPELEHVWILLYCYISNTMIESCAVDAMLPDLEILSTNVSSNGSSYASSRLGDEEKSDEEKKSALAKKRSVMNSTPNHFARAHSFI